MFLQASHVFFYPPPNAPMSPPSTLVLATGNPGKVAELRALLADLSVVLVPAADLDAPPEVVEDAGTLAGNAQKNSGR